MITHIPVTEISEFIERGYKNGTHYVAFVLTTGETETLKFGDPFAITAFISKIETLHQQQNAAIDFYASEYCN